MGTSTIRKAVLCLALFVAAVAQTSGSVSFGIFEQGIFMETRQGEKPNDTGSLLLQLEQINLMMPYISTVSARAFVIPSLP
jgi:hypothetical protein